MSLLVSAHELSKAFSHKTVFTKLSFGVQTGERIGLIGANGAGKSTLLKIISGKEDVDSGKVSFSKGVKLSYLEQDPSFKDGANILDAMLEKAVENGGDPFDWELQSKAYEFISHLGFEDAGLTAETLVSEVSGGWKKRIAFARELVLEPDLLLLDEPTNHLDVEGILWLETFLSTAPFATMTVTHDRVFLQRVSNVIFELDKRNPNGILRVDGDYAQYCETKANLIGMQEKEEATLKNTLARESEWLRRGPKARTTKSVARIKRAHNMMDKMDEVQDRNLNREVKIKFQSADKTPKKLIEAKKISKSFESKMVFQDLDLTITKTTRLGLLGTNGCGKSTLIKALLQTEPVDSGEIKTADLLKVSYFEQTRESLDQNETVMRTLCPQGDHVKFQGEFVHIRSYLDRFLFSSAQAEMAVSKLSGGEQARLLVARLMLNEANLLVLDEPTNDLDLATLNTLEEQLSAFPGAVILVSHDRYFLDHVCNQILAFPPGADDGHLVEFSSFDQWEPWFANSVAKNKESEKINSEPKAEKTKEKKQKKMSFTDQHELDNMESKIAALEAEMKNLVGRLELSQSSGNTHEVSKLSEDMGTLQKQIDTNYARWEELLALNSAD